MPHIRQANNFHHYPRRQHGAALMVMLVIMVMGTATFLVSSLSKSALSTVRQETTSAALAQAKEALIGYAASDDNRPGELPCPDINDDGVITITGPDADYSGSNCISLVGRLPWKTLGLPDLRDAAGERLWYAVSDPFHANASNALNSDTAGTLSVSGNITANNVIAILFAPGQALPGQNRSTANANNYSHYLESVVTAYTAFNLSTTDDILGGNYTYNDQMSLITSDNLFRAVEKAVASHFKNAQVVENYHSTWSALPFATASSGTYGLLPINGNAPTPYWSTIQNTSAGIPTCTLRPSGCTGSACTYARCSSYTGLSVGSVIAITGTITNAGMGFWRLYDPATGDTSGTSSCSQEICVRLSSNNLYYPASSVMNNVSISGSLNSSGQATITFTGTVRAGFIPNRVQFSMSGMPDYSSTLLDSWFASNDWQDVMYYTVSSGYVPGGSNTCNPLSGGTPPYCLTLNGNNGGADKRALVIMTGSALTGQSRAASPNALCPATGTTIAPNACLSNYLELENATPADFIYENKTRSSTFNDQVIIVAP